jgi:hypothetical protein
MFFTAHLSRKKSIPHRIQNNRTFKNIIIYYITLDFISAHIHSSLRGYSDPEERQVPPNATNIKQYSEDL